MDEEGEEDMEDQHYPDDEQYDEIDPELLEAAQKLGLDEDGIRMLQQQMY